MGKGSEERCAPLEAQSADPAAAYDPQQRSSPGRRPARLTITVRDRTPGAGGANVTDDQDSADRERPIEPLKEATLVGVRRPCRYTLGVPANDMMERGHTDNGPGGLLAPQWGGAVEVRWTDAQPAGAGGIEQIEGLVDDDDSIEEVRHGPTEEPGSSHQIGAEAATLRRALKDRQWKCQLCPASVRKQLHGAPIPLGPQPEVGVAPGSRFRGCFVHLITLGNSSVAGHRP